MALSPAQLSSLKADILANTNTIAYAGEMVQINAVPNSSDGNVAIAAWYNQLASPAFIVWRSSVSWDEIMLNGMDWTRVDNLSVGKARIWDWMFGNESKSFNPSKPNIRAGIDAVWVGTAPDLAVRAAVYTHCKRSATNAEKLFATGTGTDNSPANLSFEGGLSASDVDSARQPEVG